LQGKKEIEGTY